VNENKNRKTIRLKEYDYSSNGDYFVTICTRNRECLFGEIKDGEMVLNEVGKIVEKEILNISKRFKYTEIDIYAIMPNHVHLLMSILCDENSFESKVGAIHELPLQDAKYRRKMLIPKIIGYFKMNSAKKINILLDRMGNPVFQRNYYEEIIRNEKHYNEVYDYIVSNPSKWDEDRNNPKNVV